MYDCLINGEIGQSVNVLDRGLQYGHGVFETMAIDQGRPLFWDFHWRRLLRGCETLQIPEPAESVLLRELQTVAAGHASAVGKVTLTAGASGPGYIDSNPLASNRIVAAYPWPESVAAARRSGIRMRYCQTRLSHNRVLSRIKHLNRLEQVLAVAEWRDQAYREGLVCDQEGYVISATSANLVIVLEGRLMTPRLDRCGIRGTLRDAIRAGFSTHMEKRRITREMVAEADEVFVCNSVRGVWPVVAIEDRQYPIGNLTREIQDWLAEISPLLDRSP